MGGECGPQGAASARKEKTQKVSRTRDIVPHARHDTNVSDLVECTAHQGSINEKRAMMFMQSIRLTYPYSLKQGCFPALENYSPVATPQPASSRGPRAGCPLARIQGQPPGR
eukprot:364165-Chlamydomonas_euryale.AAC.8